MIVMDAHVILLICAFKCTRDQILVFLMLHHLVIEGWYIGNFKMSIWYLLRLRDGLSLVCNFVGRYVATPLCANARFLLFLFIT